MDSYGFVYSADGKRLLKGGNVKGRIGFQKVWRRLILEH
jgi:hypothetical protein